MVKKKCERESEREGECVCVDVEKEKMNKRWLERCLNEQRDNTFEYMSRCTN